LTARGHSPALSAVRRRETNAPFRKAARGFRPSGLPENRPERSGKK